MTNHYREVVLGSEGVEYLVDRLREGQTLARDLARRGDLERGALTTFVPLTATPQQILNFRDGIHAEPPAETHVVVTQDDGRRSRLVPKPNTDSKLVALLSSFLMLNHSRVCLFENASAEPGHEWLKRADVQIVTHDSEVYHPLTSSMNEPDAILKVIRVSRSWLFIGALTSVARGFKIDRETRKLSREDLSLLADRTERIVVGAYDGEGFLLWSHA